MRVLLANGPPSSPPVYRDITQYVLDGTLTVEDSINVPTLVSFQLSATDDSFVLPARSAYVRIVSDVYGKYPTPKSSQIYLYADIGATAYFFPIASGTQGAFHYTYPTPTSESILTLTGKSLKLQNFLGAGHWFTVDQNGNQTGSEDFTCPGGGFFEAVILGLIYVSAAGVYNITIAHQDGIQFAINGATLVSGSDYVGSDPKLGATALAGLTFLNAPPQGYNGAGAHTGSWQVAFPDEGYYEIEIDWCSQNNLANTTGVTVTMGASGNINTIPFTQRVLATGFVTNQPSPDFLGINPTLPSHEFQQLAYSVQVTSDEWILNCQDVPFIPAFVNQTDSQILASIAEVLMPGFFDTKSCMASGTLVPYYQYDPSQTWSDIAKTFADQNRYWYRVKDRKIYYQPFGQNPIFFPQGLGMSYDETTGPPSSKFPLQMKTSVVSVPPVNDCIVIGDTEPQTNVDLYTVGDGFTSNFVLKNQMFRGVSSDLLSDDWTEASFTSGTWIVNDPQGEIVLADSNGNPIGALNVIQKGFVNSYAPVQNSTFIQAQNGLELGGGLNLQHGQITVNDSAAGGGGIVGGIFEETTEFDPGHCLAAFKLQGQPSLGSFTVVSVSVSGGFVYLKVNGTNTTLNPGNVCVGSSFGGASFLNGENLYITAITQNSGNFVITGYLQNPGVLPGSYGPTSDSGHITFNSDAVITTASGAAGVYIYPLYLGSVTGSPVISQPNHQYVLQTWIGAEAPTRYTRPYTNITQTTTYGAQALTASGSISWLITDYNLGLYVVEQQYPLFGLFPAAPPPVVTKFTAYHQNLPPFAAYVLVSGLNLNISLNYTVINVPPQGYLTVQSLTGASGGSLPWLPSQLTPPIPYQLGFGMINQTAQISQSNQSFELSFYTDDIPSVGARIRFQSWSAGQSIARVRDLGAIANEAKISGDSGVRSAIMQNLSPLPRTSAECEAAAAAAILDREYPQFQGSYTVETAPFGFDYSGSLFSPSLYDYPHTGMFFYVNSPARGVSGNFFAQTVRFQVVETRSEVMVISIDYGPDLYLEKLLPNFLEREQNLLVPTQQVPPPNPITLPEVLNANLPTLDSAQVISIVNAVSGNYIVVDLSGGVELNAATSNGILSSIGATGCEVRYVDNGWGVPNAGRVGIFTVDQFVLPRTTRDQTFYLRGLGGPLGGSGLTPVFSRFSKALRIAYPLVPSSPALRAYNQTQISLDLAGDVRDIYGLEIRVPSVSGVNYVIAQGAAESIGLLSRVALPSNFPTMGDAYAEYFPLTGESFTFQKGDIVYFAPIQSISPARSDFYPGFRLIVDNGTSSAGGSTGKTYTGPVKSINQAPVSQGSIDSIIVQANAAGPNPTPGTTLWVYYNRSEPNFGGPDMNLYSAWANAQAKGYTLYVTFANLPSPFTGLNGTPYPVTFACNWNTWVTPPGGSHNWFYFGVDVGGSPALLNTNFIIPQNTTGTYQWIYGTSGTNPTTYDWFSWFDYGYGPTTVSVSNQTVPVATCQLLQRGSYWAVSGGMIDSSGNATLYTTTPHGLSAGEVIITSLGNVPAGPEGAIFNVQGGQWQITAVPSSASLQFAMGAAFAGNVGSYPLTGIIAQMPVTSTSLGVSGSILIQKVVTAPSDLVIDLTNPQIQAILTALQASTPNGRIQGLEALFFNLTWDYSPPTAIPAFAVPALSGFIIDPVTNGIVWSIAQGVPNGYRAEVLDQATLLTRNKFTVNHPNNPVLLKQFQMTALDSPFPCTVLITPFDDFGDGIPSVVLWPGFGGGGTSSQSGPTSIVVDLPLTGAYIPGNIIEIGAPFFVGDSGAGGQAGTVPPPPAGSAAANEFLSASGTWATPASAGVQPYHIIFSLPGNPPVITFPIETFPITVNFAANFAGSVGTVGTNPASTAVYTIQKNGGTVGTVSISTGGVFTFASTGGTAVSFTSGDRMTIIAPNPQDTSLADVAITLVGTR